MQRNDMWCALMWGAVICCEVMRCNGMGSYESVIWCCWLQCHVVVRSGCVMWWLGRWPSDPYYTVLQCTIKCYSELQDTTMYYSILQSTTKYYSELQSTTKYYSVLQWTTKDYKVLQSTAPYFTVLQSTTRYNEVLQSTTPSYEVLLTLYLKAYYKLPPRTTKNHSLQKFYTILVRLIVQDMNAQYNARSNRTDSPTSPNTAPATKNHSHDWSSSHMKCHSPCAEQQDSPCNITKYCTCREKWLAWLVLITYESSCTLRRSNTNVTKDCACHEKSFPWLIDPRHRWNVIYNGGRFDHDPSMIRPWFTEYCACHEKWHCNITKYCTWLWTSTTLSYSYTTLSYFTQSCYVTELWLYWTIALLNCYLTELLL